MSTPAPSADARSRPRQKPWGSSSHSQDVSWDEAKGGRCPVGDASAAEGFGGDAVLGYQAHATPKEAVARETASAPTATSHPSSIIYL